MSASGSRDSHACNGFRRKRQFVDFLVVEVYEAVVVLYQFGAFEAVKLRGYVLEKERRVEIPLNAFPVRHVVPAL